jgi:hypothetical protein
LKDDRSWSGNKREREDSLEITPSCGRRSEKAAKLPIPSNRMMLPEGDGIEARREQRGQREKSGASE